jgi:hypothetical protein
VANQDKNYNVLTLKLKTEIYQEHILEKRINICRMIYNSMVNIVKKQINKLEHDVEYTQTKKLFGEKYKELKSMESKILKLENEKDDIKVNKLKTQEKKLKGEFNEIKNNLNKIYQKYNLTKFDMYKLITPIYKTYNCHIQSLIAQDISFRIWKSVEKYLFEDGKKIKYKKYNEYDSVSSVSHNQIIYKEGYIQFKGLKLKIVIENEHEQYILDNENIKLIQIKRKYIKNKYKYYAGIVHEGNSISLYKKQNTLGKGDIGIDIGTQTIAIVSESNVKLLELADRIQNMENEKRKLLRHMDRSRRITNPDNFNKDGTIKKQGNKKVKWIKSNNYTKAQNKLKELYRKQANIRKLQHWELANEIVKQGNIVKVEKMNFKGLQKRSKKTEKNEDGKFKRKKRFGKSLGNKAPSMCLQIIKIKIESLGGEFRQVNTKELKASQYNHFTNEYTKKKLSQRWTKINGKPIQRDLYSAFLLKHVNDDNKSYNNEKLNIDFENFKTLHDKEIERIKNQKIYKISSMGIKN